ncbi:MAG TPA: hypothetical protein PK156_37745 [Polyangium sp.]|nr:hypothetical protein [Polyangium sp.]
MTGAGDQRPGQTDTTMHSYPLCLFLVALALGCSQPAETIHQQLEVPRASIVPSAAPVETAAAPVSSPNHSSSNLTPSAAPTRTPQPGEIGLLYACGEKYAVPDQCTADSEQYAQWLDTVEVKPSDGRIVHIHEGGPLGAEWNPSNDLVVFAPIAQGPRALRVESKVISPGKMISRGWVVFRVPYRNWRSAERRPRKSDGLEGSAESRAVSVVELELTSDQDPKTRTTILLTAYGE